MYTILVISVIITPNSHSHDVSNETDSINRYNDKQKQNKLKVKP